MRLVDTNILLYSISTRLSEAPKMAIARSLLKSRDLVLSVQVLQEFYVQATRRGRADALTHEEAIAFIETWKRFPVVHVTVDLFHAALEIKSKHQLSYWDSAIIAAAGIAGCSEVLSEDMSPEQDYGGVRVVNPFNDANAQA